MKAFRAVSAPTGLLPGGALLLSHKTGDGLPLFGIML
jgi:hypothetical protein